MILSAVTPSTALSSLVTQAAQQAQTAIGAKTVVLSKLVDTGSDLAVNLVIAIVIVAVTVWVAGWVGRLTERALGGFHHRHEDPTLRIFVASVARNAVFIIGGIAVLTQLGVKTTSIIAVVGTASLAIGLAMQGALSNVAAGVMMLFLRPYRVGDIIDSAGKTGQVRALDLLVTEMATLDNLKIVIPNGKVFADVIVNHSFHPKRRADVIFRVPLTADVPAMMLRLRQRLQANPLVLDDPAPLIEVTGMSEAFVEIAVRPWAASADYGPVKADMLLCARLLEADAKAALPAISKDVGEAPLQPAPGRRPARARSREPQRRRALDS